MGKLWIFFRADLPERKKRFPSWAGAENLQRIWISAKKTAFFLRLVQEPDRWKWPAFTSFYERSNSGYAIKPKRIILVIWATELDTDPSSSTCQPSSIDHRSRGTVLDILIPSSKSTRARSSLTWIWSDRTRSKLSSSTGFAYPYRAR